MSERDPTTTRGGRCPQCGQPLLLGRCGLCGYVAPATPAAPAAPTTPAGPDAPTQAGPAAPPPRPVPTPGPSTVPSPNLAPASEPSKPEPTGGRLSPLVVGAIAVGAVLALLLVYLAVTVSGLRSDVSALKDDQRATSERMQQLEGESSVLSSNADDLRKTIESQAASDPAAVSTRVQPSVYTIEVPDGLGSGWVAQSDGVTSNLVTNYHVVESAVRNGSNYVAVYQDKGAVLDGTVVLSVPDQDLALVSVHAKLPVLQQSVEQVKAGQSILVVGSPLGLGSSVSTGSIANPSRDFLGVTYIQFTAPISPGNSGGAVVDLTGKVIGVTEAKLVGEGIEGVGFAIPVTNVCSFLHVCAS